MPEPPSAAIDIGVLALPRDQGTATAIHGYIAALLEWSALMGEGWLDICISEISVAALLSHERYPLPESLRQMLSASAVSEYDANTVSRMATRLIEMAPSLESRFAVRNALLDEPSLSPDPGKAGTESCLRPELERCLALLAIVRFARNGNGRNGPSLILRSAPAKAIECSCLVYEIEHSLDKPPALPEPPERFCGSVPVCDSFGGLLGRIDETEMLANATDDAALLLAVRIAVYKYDLESNGQAKWPSPTPLRIGPHFRQSCQRCCHDKGPAMPNKIMRVLVETARRQKLNTVHALRTDVKGSSPQRTRGQDKAWRRDIDRKIHLHYWECAQGVHELASVSFHDDFSIPE